QLGTRNSELGTRNSELGTQNSERCDVPPLHHLPEPSPPRDRPRSRRRGHVSANFITFRVPSGRLQRRPPSATRPPAPPAPPPPPRRPGAVRRDRIDLEGAAPRRLLVQASARVQSLLQLLAQLEGRLDATAAADFNPHDTPAWNGIRAAVMEALEPFPEASKA